MGNNSTRPRKRGDRILAADTVATDNTGAMYVKVGSDQFQLLNSTGHVAHTEPKTITVRYTQPAHELWPDLRPRKSGAT